MIAHDLSRLYRAGWNPHLSVLRPGANRDGLYLVVAGLRGDRREFEGSSPEVALRRAVKALTQVSGED